MVYLGLMSDDLNILKKALDCESLCSGNPACHERVIYIKKILDDEILILEGWKKVIDMMDRKYEAGCKNE